MYKICRLTLNLKLSITVVVQTLPNLIDFLLTFAQAGTKKTVTADFNLVTTHRNNCETNCGLYC